MLAAVDDLARLRLEPGHQLYFPAFMGMVYVYGFFEGGYPHEITTMNITKPCKRNVFDQIPITAADDLDTWAMASAADINITSCGG